MKTIPVAGCWMLTVRRIVYIKEELAFYLLSAFAILYGGINI